MQDTTHFLLFDGDTIQADSELLTMRWRPTDHKRCQLEHLKQQKLISRTWQLIGVEATTQLDTIYTLYRCRRARKPACAEQNDRTSPTSGWLLVDDRSSCRCSCTKEWYSARHASVSLPLVQPFSKSPTRSLLKSWNGATSSPPTTIAGHKRLKPCPMAGLEAKIDRTQFTKCSRKRRASWQNSTRRYWVPTLSNAAITRVPARKSLSSIAENREWVGTTYSPHCSTRGKDDAFLSFCSRR